MPLPRTLYHIGGCALHAFDVGIGMSANEEWRYHLPDVENLRSAILDASVRTDVREAVDRVYAELQSQIDLRRPVCVVSGRCCRFEEFGHRLYVTTLELARFMMDLKVPPPQPSLVRLSSPKSGVPGEGKSSVAATPPDASRTGGCMFQLDKLCSVHAIRPFGCRIFFCDASSTEWQRSLYERLHARLRTLHDELGVPYHYVEWRHALAHILEPRGAEGLKPA